MGLVLLHVVMPHRHALLRSRLKQKTEGNNVRSLYVVANPKKRTVKASNLVQVGKPYSSAVQLSRVHVVYIHHFGSGAFIRLGYYIITLSLSSEMQRWRACVCGEGCRSVCFGQTRPKETV